MTTETTVLLVILGIVIFIFLMWVTKGGILEFIADIFDDFDFDD
jgi:hypothetical protein